MRRHQWYEPGNGKYNYGAPVAPVKEEEEEACDNDQIPREEERNETGVFFGYVPRRESKGGGHGELASSPSCQKAWMRRMR
jgi:hypothetical protein